MFQLSDFLLGPIWISGMLIFLHPSLVFRNTAKFGLQLCDISCTYNYNYDFDVLSLFQPWHLILVFDFFLHLKQWLADVHRVNEAENIMDGSRPILEFSHFRKWYRFSFSFSYSFSCFENKYVKRFLDSGVHTFHINVLVLRKCQNISRMKCVASLVWKIMVGFESLSSSLTSS